MEKAAPFTRNDLEEHCSKNELDPEAEPDVSGIVAWKIQNDKFYIIWSTNKLINRQKNSELLQVKKIMHF